MPLYDYKCPECGDRREVLQKMSDLGLPSCTSCEAAPPMVKQVTAPLAPRFRAAGGGRSGGGSRPVDTSQIPYAGRDGAIYTPRGQKMITPDGRKA